MMKAPEKQTLPPGRHQPASSSARAFETCSKDAFFASAALARSEKVSAFARAEARSSEAVRRLSRRAAASAVSLSCSYRVTFRTPCRSDARASASDAWRLARSSSAADLSHRAARASAPAASDCAAASWVRRSSIDLQSPDSTRRKRLVGAEGSPFEERDTS